MTPPPHTPEEYAYPDGHPSQMMIVRWRKPRASKLEWRRYAPDTVLGTLYRVTRSGDEHGIATRCGLPSAGAMARDMGYGSAERVLTIDEWRAAQIADAVTGAIAEAEGVMLGVNDEVRERAAALREVVREREAAVAHAERPDAFRPGASQQQHDELAAARQALRDAEAVAGSDAHVPSEVIIRAAAARWALECERRGQLGGAEGQDYRGRARAIRAALVATR